MPDPRVANGEVQGGVLGRQILGLDEDGDFTLMRELDGIADQVDDHLPEPCRIADQGVGDVGV